MALENTTIDVEISTKTGIFTTLLLDCDNTLALTEEHAFAATSETINALLRDFEIPSQTHTGNGTSHQQLTRSALYALDLGLARGSPEDNDPTNPLHAPTVSAPIDDDYDGFGGDVTDPERYQTYSTPSLLADYIGLPFKQILQAITLRHGIVLTPEQQSYYTTLEEQNVNTQIKQNSPAAPGIENTLQRLAASGRFKHTAVVSSSSLPRVRSALTKATLYPVPFDDSVLYSAHDSLPVPAHKPSPAIYLHALSDLGVSAAECIAVEDSISGCLAAVNAQIACVGYVGAYHDPGKRDVMAGVLKDRGAVAVISEWEEFIDVVQMLQEGRRQE